MASLRKGLMRVFVYLRRLSDAFSTHQCSLMACACAYCTLLSLVPLLIVAIAGLGFFLGGSQTALREVVSGIRAYLPISPILLKEILTNVLQDRQMIGVFGLTGLLYAAHQIFLAMQPAMNLVWGVPETRHWFRQRLIAFAMTFYALALMGADLVLSGFLTYIQTVKVPPLVYRAEPFVIKAGTWVLPMFLTTLMIVLVYQFLPSCKVPFKAAALGAVVAGLLWQLSKIVFTISLLYIHSYDRLYGSLSGLVILVVWTYYSMVILMLGAEVAADYAALGKGLEVAEERAHTSEPLSVAKGVQARPQNTKIPRKKLPRRRGTQKR